MRYFSIILTLFFTSTLFAKALPLSSIHLPPGFKISVYAVVPGARSLALGDDGVVFVGTKDVGKVYALLPEENFSQAKKVIVIAQNLTMPNGVAYYNGDLYVAEMQQILRFPNIQKNLENPKYNVIYNLLPTNKHHGWRYIGISPDHWLYIAIGAPCNICENNFPFATISRIRLDGTNFQEYAKGIRNSVGFDWNPVTQQLWFTDNGQDWMGMNIPPDELNNAPHKGMDFGFPYYWGNNHPEPKYGKLRSVNGMTPPVLEIPAHEAPLGMRFYTGKMFPKEYENQIFIAEHGSWNRLLKVGYQVRLIKIKNNKPVESEVFASGWLRGQRNWGRPVDVLVMPDGSLLISDDDAGVVYRIVYKINNNQQ